MQVNFHVQDHELTHIDGHVTDNYNWLQLTQWTCKYDEAVSPRHRDISYQVALYFDSVDDVNRLVNVLNQMKEEMYAKELESSIVDRSI